LNQSLAELTTLRLGGPAGRLVRATTEDELIGAVRAADEAEGELFLLGGGSNIVVADEGIPGTVVQVATSGIAAAADPEDSAGSMLVTAAAGENWVDFVNQAVREGWSGIEALAGIPGTLGAAPIQNIGAYGQEVAETIVSVRAFDRLDGEIVTLGNAACRFRYRSSLFKDSERFVILSVTFKLALSRKSGPVRYRELASKLGVRPQGRVPAWALRDAVLELRSSKGMVLDPADADTYSAGSFFMNPILKKRAANALPPEAPRWPMHDGQIKTSAAWLIEQAGFQRGHGPEHGRVSLSHKHTLALTNRGSASTADLLELAREVRAGVQAAFDVTLVPEPQLVNCAL
jgi:UDP-N-acetylmuramate dehydrogenase